MGKGLGFHPLGLFWSGSLHLAQTAAQEATPASLRGQCPPTQLLQAPVRWFLKLIYWHDLSLSFSIS